MARLRHPNKEIEAAISAAEDLGWTVYISPKGHAWGHLYCPKNDRDGCIISVWSTPRSKENHARSITRKVKLCPGSHGVEDEKS